MAVANVTYASEAYPWDMRDRNVAPVAHNPSLPASAPSFVTKERRAPRRPPVDNLLAHLKTPVRGGP